jgi:hypothetical protein
VSFVRFVVNRIISSIQQRTDDVPENLRKLRKPSSIVVQHSRGGEEIYPSYRYDRESSLSGKARPTLLTIY